MRGGAPPSVVGPKAATASAKAPATISDAALKWALRADQVKDLWERPGRNLH